MSREYEIGKIENILKNTKLLQCLSCGTQMYVAKIRWFKGWPDNFYDVRFECPQRSWYHFGFLHPGQRYAIEFVG